MEVIIRKFLVYNLNIFLFLLTSLSSGQNIAWVNEIHYDNNGADINEAIEIVIENPDNLYLYELYLYKDDGSVYAHIYLDNSGISVGTTVGNFSFFTWNPSSGIQNGPSDGIALVYNGTVVSGQFISYEGTLIAIDGPAAGMTSVDIGTSQSESNFFYESLQLIGQGSIYSDFSWNTPGQSTFGEINDGQTLGGIEGNANPIIFNISQFPVEENVTPNDMVDVFSEIVDSDGISAVNLSWGTTSGNLPNIIAMNLISGNTYSISSEIPSQTEGTHVFYTIEAIDNNAMPASTVTTERTYTVGAPATQGWQITAVDVPFQIDFETNTVNVNEGKFAASGFQPFPESGQLDSNSWSVTGFSDGDLEFGGNKVVQNTDYTQGVSTGNITPGGIYAFVIGSSVCLGIQPTGPDFTPGSIRLRLQNTSGAVITKIEVSYDLFVRNNENRSNSFNFGYSTDNINYTNSATVFTSVDSASDFPHWKKYPQTESITGISIAPESYYYLRWASEDITGNGSRDEFGLDNIRLVANPVSTEYVYNGSWTPSDPNAVADQNDNITVLSGSAVLNEPIVINNIQIENAAELKIESILELHGGITNNGNLIFVNDGNNLGQLAATSATGHISGTTVQRHIPARRAFRFLSSAVSTATSIHENWQEGAVSNISNPEPGFGTHITGSLIDQVNGFDATGSGNPSLFLFDNASQTWENIENTDINIIEKGKPYRLFVRGDRSIELTDNETIPTNTILRATGDLVLGNYQENLAETADYYNFIGNPFQAIVNMNEVLENSTNLNPNNYYVWDPNMNDRGGYVTVALPHGENYLGSEANQFLQPGQAALVRTLNNGQTSILFEQNDKVPFQNATNVFKGMLNEEVNASINLQLFEAAAFMNEGSVADGLRLNFNTNGNNQVMPNDAPKLGNLDENVALLINGNNYLSIANRAMPMNEESIQLFTNQYRHANYIFKIEVKNLPQNTTAFIKDEFLQTETQLINNTVNFIDFGIDETIAESIAPDRFSFRFGVNELAVDKAVSSNIITYPNPVRNGRFFILLPKNSAGIPKISLFDILGKEVFQQNKLNFSGQEIEMDLPAFLPGIYSLRIEINGETYTEKIVFF